MSKIYVSFDWETDGRSPVISNGLQFGLTILDENRNELFAKCWNLAPRKGKVPTKSAQEFWESRKEQYESMLVNQVEPAVFIAELNEILKQFSDRQWVWLAYPVSFDWCWLSHYYFEFSTADEGEPDIGYEAVCIDTLFDQYCKDHNLAGAEKKALKLALMKREELTHNALDDAREQANLYFGLTDLLSK